MIKLEGLRQISPHVWAIPDNNVPLVSNIGFVVGTKATLVIDTGLGARNGEIVLSAARKLAPNNALYLVTTHVHPEHDLGAQAFPASARMIRSKDQNDEIAADGLKWVVVFSQRSPFIAGLLKDARFRPADITYDQSYSLDLGGVSANIAAMGDNHTRGDTAIFVPGDAVLFDGDLAMARSPSFNSGGGTINGWLATLDKLDDLRPQVLVPSHARIAGPELIANYRAFLIKAKARSAELKREGKSLEETQKLLTAELTPFFPDSAERIGGTVRIAYNEAG